MSFNNLIVLSVLALVPCLCLVQSEETDQPVCSSTYKFEIIRKSDCSGFYMCVWGKPVEMPNCPYGMLFSEIAHTCVLPNNKFNDCVTEQYKHDLVTESSTTHGSTGILHVVCAGLDDGAHQDEHGRCDRYTVCEGGQYISSIHCTDGLNFDPVTRGCRPAESFCGVCGNCPDKEQLPDAQ